MTIDAAVDGQGTAPARTALASWDLLSGRLVRPFSQALEAPYAFWIACPKSAADLPKISTFRSWLLRETEDDARRIAELGSRSRAAPRLQLHVKTKCYRDHPLLAISACRETAAQKQIRQLAHFDSLRIVCASRQLPVDCRQTGHSRAHRVLESGHYQDDVRAEGQE